MGMLLPKQVKFISRSHSNKSWDDLTEMRHRLIPFSILFIVVIAILTAGCMPVRLALPIRGTVVDEETGKGIPGAAVELSVTTICETPFQPIYKTLQEAETQSNNKGRFHVGGGVNNLLPTCLGWENKINVAAPGYYKTRIYVRDSIAGFPLLFRWFIPAKVRLARIQYLSQLYHYQRHGYDFKHYTTDEDLSKRSKSLHYRKIGLPGVFLTSNDKTFNRITIEYGNIYATSSGKDKIVGWDSMGHPIELTGKEGLSRLGLGFVDRKTEMLSSLKNWMSHLKPGDPLGEEVLKGLVQNESEIECICNSSRPGIDVPYNYQHDYPFIIIMQENGVHAVYLITRPVQQDRGRPQIEGVGKVFRTTFPNLENRISDIEGLWISQNGKALPYKVEIANFVETKVTACKLYRDSLFVAFEKQGIRKFLLPKIKDLKEGPLPEPEQKFWWASRPASIEAPDGPKIFTDIEISWDRATGDGILYALNGYAVNGGSEIYRFTLDGVPDRRIEFE